MGQGTNEECLRGLPERSEGAEYSPGTATSEHCASAGDQSAAAVPCVESCTSRSP